MNALADEKVGEFVNDHFVSAWQKVGTFRVVNGEKQGGNVASYFCRTDGTVVHAVAGPVDAATFLAEAKFAVELDKLAQLDGGKSEEKQKKVVADAHLKRVKMEARGSGWGNVSDLRSSRGDKFHADFHKLDTPGKVSALLWSKPLAPLEEVYPQVWEKVLNQSRNVAPVVVK